MAKVEHVEQVRTANYLSMLTGLWLIIAPAMMGFGNNGLKWSSVIAGVVVLAMGATQEMRLEYTWPDTIAALVGVWAIFAPYAFSGATTGAMWAGGIGGALAIGFSVWGYEATAEDRLLRHA